jgi:hypothetical protein
VSSCVEYANVGLFDVTFKDGSQRKKVPREDIRFPNMHSTEDVSYCENWTRANEAVILQRRKVKQKIFLKGGKGRTMADQYMLSNGTFGETKEAALASAVVAAGGAAGGAGGGGGKKRKNNKRGKQQEQQEEQEEEEEEDLSYSQIAENCKNELVPTDNVTREALQADGRAMRR